MPSANPGCSPSTDAVKRTFRHDAATAPTVAIVGGGFSGVMVAAHLLRAAYDRDTPLHVALIERSASFEGGAAYRTDSSRHVLNVPCARMGAYADDPEHFLRWLRTRDPEVRGDAYVPRALFRDYLQAVLDDAIEATSGLASFEWIEVEAADVIEAPWAEGTRVVLRDGRAIDASSVVLAIGNLPPGHPGPADRLRDSAFYVRDPWRNPPPAIDDDEPVLLIGTGLTMLDYALALDERGHRGSIVAVSRHGLLPEGHADTTTDALCESARQAVVARVLLRSGVDRQRTARGLLQAVRVAIADAADRNVAWQHVIAALRPRVAGLWQACSERERARFLRHVRRYWDVVRHRAAPETVAQLGRLRGAERVTVIAGEVLELLDDAWGVTAILRERGSDVRRVVRAAAVVNCTGPETRVAHADHALLQALLRRGLVHADALGLGVDTTPDGFAVRADGCVWPRLVVVGALNRARLWESTAVEELRVQAGSAAGLLAGCLLQPRARAVAA